MRTLALALLLPLLAASALAQGPIRVDHNATDLRAVPATWIQQARAQLHIAYGHTSHGSQVSSGMSGLVGFTGGCGGPQFAWNRGGTGGALDMHDSAMGGDVGYYPQWVNNTVAYLNNPSNAHVNVIIWSWCGQVSNYTAQDMITRYLQPMSQLETQYPNVTFVYMTGHVNIWARQNTNERNQQIRDHCRTNARVLYDFADIESYDPDGRYFAHVNDSCDYYAPGSTTPIGNWATEWQNAHVQGVDWYACSSAHSQPLNANLKAYAAWWLWARLAGWSGPTELAADTDVLSWSSGGSVDFQLDAGMARGGELYLLLGGLSGTAPGFALPGGLATLPLSWDVFTDICLQSANSPALSGFAGTLDRSGTAAARLTFGPLPPAAESLTMHFSYLLVPALDLCSNAVSVRFIP